jgi:hypothetical protein
MMLHVLLLIPVLQKEESKERKVTNTKFNKGERRNEIFQSVKFPRQCPFIHIDDK